MICSICGRKLINPQSVELGYGPVCYRKAFGKMAKIKVRDTKEMSVSCPSYDIPGQISIEEYLNEIV